MKLRIEIDNSPIVYKESGELPEEFMPYIYQADNQYSGLTGFYQPYIII